MSKLQRGIKSLKSIVAIGAAICCSASASHSAKTRRGAKRVASCLALDADAVGTLTLGAMPVSWHNVAASV